MSKLRTGDTFPELIFHTAFSGDVSSADLIKEKTALWFLRYAGCTLCRYDLFLARQAYEDYRAKGWNMIFVLQSDREHVLADYAKDRPPYEIVCDKKMELYKALEIIPAASFEDLFQDKKTEADAKLEKAMSAGFEHGDPEGEELQLPAVFVVDENRKVL